MRDRAAPPHMRERDSERERERDRKDFGRRR